jgi:CheY-like chemotaxis protein
MKPGRRMPMTDSMAKLSERRVAMVGFAGQEAVKLRRLMEREGAFCHPVNRDDAGPAVTTLDTFDAVVLAVGGDVITLAMEQAIIEQCARPVLAVGSEANLQRYQAALERPARGRAAATCPPAELVGLLEALPPATTVAAVPIVLIADDDPVTSVVLEAMLSKEGLACHVAADGDEAIALARAFHPDAIILDVNMPGHDGFQVLQILRADPATAGAHVLMLTGRAEESDVLRGCALGADGYIAKPFKSADVAGRLKALLAGAAA